MNLMITEVVPKISLIYEDDEMEADEESQGETKEDRGLLDQVESPNLTQD